MEHDEDFLVLALHHLRQPMMTIVLWERLLREHPGDADVQVRALDAIRRSTEEQARMIANVLDLSRARRGTLRLEVEPVYAERLLDETLRQFLVRATAANVVVSHEPRQRLGRVLADPGRLRQILSHMILTALGGTPAGGKICVSGRRVRGAIAITVTDSGYGFDEEATDPSHDLERKLCRRLAELLGGSLVHASSARAATWTLTLPMLNAASHADID